MFKTKYLSLLLATLLLTACNPKAEEPATEVPTNPLISVESPKAGETVSSPLVITGQARGYWYFEASFPVELLDANGQRIANNIATAQDEWMTEEFVPFKAELTFDKPTTATGSLVLHKDNPSGMPENEDSITIPVKF